MITSRKAESCEEAAKEIGPNVVWEAGNIGRLEDAERVIGATLCGSAGSTCWSTTPRPTRTRGRPIDVDLARWEKTLQVNLTAPLFWTQAAWKGFMREHGGAVVNISSVGGLATNAILGVYDVSKAALIHLTKQLAAELGPKVRVNAIAPGLIKTDFAKVLWEKGRGGAGGPHRSTR